MNTETGRMRWAAVAVMAVLAAIAAALGAAAYGQGEGTSNRPPALRSKGEEVTRLEVAQGAEIGDLAIRDQTGRVKSSWYFKDPDGDSLTFTATVSAGFGWLRVAPVQGGQLFALSGVPGADAVGDHAVAFKITASDGQAKTKVKVLIRVTGANNPPEELSPPGEKAFEVGGTKAFDHAFAAADYARDIDGDALSLRFRGQLPRWLSATPSSGAAASVTLAGDPDPRDVGEHSLTMRVKDGRGGRLDIPVTVTVHANRPPALKPNLEAELKTLGTDEGEPFSFARADGSAHNELHGSWYFEDPDGDDMTFTLTSSVGWLEVGGDLGGGRFQVIGRPPAGVTGNIGAVLTLTASDGQDSTPYRVSVEIIPGNHHPEVRNPPLASATLATAEDTAIAATVAGSNYFQDPDGDALTYTLTLSTVSNVSWISVTDRGDGSFSITGTPPENYSGTFTDALTMIANDGSLTASRMLAVEVTPVNDGPEVRKAPLASATLTTAEDMAIAVTVVGSNYFDDPDGDAMTFTLTPSADSNVSWIRVEDLGDGSFSVTGTPLANYWGTLGTALTMVASDGALTASRELAVEVTPVNDPPHETDPPGTKAFRKTGSGDVLLVFRAADYAEDIEGDLLTVDFPRSPGLPGRLDLPDWLTATPAAGGAEVTLAGDRSQRFVLDSIGTHRLVMRVEDGNGGSLDIDIVLDVHRNRLPVLKDPLLGPTTLTTEEETPLTAIVFDSSNYFEDPDGDSLEYQMTQLSPTYYWVNEEASWAETWVGVENLGGGRFRVTGTPPPDYSGLIELGLMLTATERWVTAAGVVIAIDITPVEDAPRETDPPGPKAFEKRGAGNFSQVFRVADYAFDPDGDPLTVSFPEASRQSQSQGQPAWPGWLTATVSDDGSEVTLSGNPADGDAAVNPPLTLAMEVTDGKTAPLSIPVTLAVHANRRPSARSWPLVERTLTTAEDTPIAEVIFDVSGRFRDADGDSLSYAYRLSPDASWMEVEVLGDGRFQVSGTPPRHYWGTIPAALTLTASDGELTGGHEITVDVTPVEDAPELKPSAPTTLTTTWSEYLWFNIYVADYFEDPEGDALTFTLTANVNWLDYGIHGPRFEGESFRVTGFYLEDYLGTIESALTLTANDGKSQSSIEIAVEFSSVNQSPQVRNPPLATATLTTREDTAIDATVHGYHYFKDPDGQGMFFTLTPNEDWLRVENLPGDGFRVTGTPPRDYSGTLGTALTMTASDGLLLVSRHLAVEVTPVNDAPRGTSQSGTKAFTNAGLVIGMTAGDGLDSSSRARFARTVEPAAATGTLRGDSAVVTLPYVSVRPSGLEFPTCMSATLTAPAGDFSFWGMSYDLHPGGCLGAAAGHHALPVLDGHAGAMALRVPLAEFAGDAGRLCMAMEFALDAADFDNLRLTGMAAVECLAQGP